MLFLITILIVYILTLTATHVFTPIFLYFEITILIDVRRLIVTHLRVIYGEIISIFVVLRLHTLASF